VNMIPLHPDPNRRSGKSQSELILQGKQNKWGAHNTTLKSFMDGANMRIIGKSILIILVAALLLPVLTSGVGNVESRPAEKVAEDLFNKGIGNPWVSGDPFKSTSGTDHAWVQGAPTPSPSYQIIGYLDVYSGLIIAPDAGNSILLKPGAGRYPVYAYFNGDKMTGIFIDFSSSG
jgi:hypothetical protein